MTKIEAANRLHRQLLACKRCKDLWKPPVPPEGDLNAKIMLLGRNPGRVEHKLGRPFAGPDAPGGRLLDEELSRIGLPRVNCWVTNLCDCYSESDRQPSSLEVENCFPYLRFQLLLIKPKLVVAMGKQAGTKLIGKSIVWEEERGRPRVIFLENSDLKFILLPVTHPGEAIRGRRDKMYKDFNILRELLSRGFRSELIEHPIKLLVGRIGESKWES